MLKLFTLILLTVISFSVHAQLGYGANQYAPAYQQWDTSALAKKKWSLQPYAGFSTAFMFSKAGNASIFSAPMGLQLTRQFNNNLYAFGRLSLTPAYININQAFMNMPATKFTTGSPALYSGIEGGLMYINDQRTFSISGSIRVDRGSYSAYPYYSPNNQLKQPIYK